MKKDLKTYDILFEVTDVFGKLKRTTKNYWEKIKQVKHRELKYGIAEVKSVLNEPDEVRRSVTDTTIFLYAKRVEKYDMLIVAVKILNDEGFIVTTYQTKTYKQKGELLWPKEKIK